MIELLASDMQISQMAVEIGNLADMTNPVSDSNRFSISGFRGARHSQSFLSVLAPRNATQTICGKLFMEMWTNDDAGFPFPRGCAVQILDGEMGWSH
jgi:hypothetical protein